METTWFWLAVATAGSLSACDALSKVALRRASPAVLVLARMLGAVPPLWALWWVRPEARVEPALIPIVLVAVPLEVWATKWYVDALKLSDLSVVVPLLALTPVLLVPVGSLLTDQSLGGGAVGAILLVAIGAYLLNAAEVRGGGWSGPFRALARDPGARRMLGVATIYSVTASLGKRALRHADPITFGSVYFTIVALAVAIVWRRELGELADRTRARPVLLTLVALTSAAMLAFHFLSLDRADVAAMIAVKRLSLVFSVIVGVVAFREGQATARLLASLLMVGGAAWLYLGG